MAAPPAAITKDPSRLANLFAMILPVSSPNCPSERFVEMYGCPDRPWSKLDGGPMTA